ncbi:uncharacterized protein [Chironomus tepperi]|uniref:uncharacterized protein n=1 Tax=Chironomus tepperi TaxID=113505 RepID=UPI00391FAB78
MKVRKLIIASLSLILVYVQSVPCLNINSSYHEDLSSSNHVIGDNSSLVSHRSARYFPFYTLGRFSQDVCVGSNSLTGTCMLKGQCNDLGGTLTGTTSCSQANTPQASCCILVKTCGGFTQTNNTYFVNVNYPATFAGGSRCNLRVTRMGTDVCQLKISFLDMSLAPPTGDGVCSSDYFTVTGGSSFVPKICGENSGQHVYVDFAGDNPVTITVATSSAFTFNRRWHLHVQQIGCDSTSRAPFGCLQYWTDASNTISSFNYDSAGSGQLNNMGMQGTRQIANLAYGSCILAQPGMCSITWSLPGTDIFAFSLTNDVGAVIPSILGSVQVQSQVCQTDFVVIPNAQQNGAAMPSDRFCGLGLAPTTSNIRPFVIYSVTDGNENQDISNRGWSLSYIDYLKCGQTTDEDVVMLTNPRYPDGYRNGTVCNYYIRKSHHHVTQLRVEFIYFSLAPPTGDGLCTRDYISIESDSLNVPRLCGELSGQHYYIHIPNIPRFKRFFKRRHGKFLPLNIKIAASSSYAYTRRWKIRVIQIAQRRRKIDHFERRLKLVRNHDVVFRAPLNCLQYFINTTGNIQSFNYASSVSGQYNSIGVVGTRQIANLNYTICIRQDPLMCAIIYSLPTSDAYAFTLTGDVSSIPHNVLGTSAVQSQACTTDYITIPSQMQQVNNVWTPMASNLSCGLGFAPKLSNIKPFTIKVVTNGNETIDIGNRGFFLNYRQQFTCT